MADLALRARWPMNGLMGQSWHSGRRSRSRVWLLTLLGVLGFGLGLVSILPGGALVGLQPSLAIEVSSVVNPRQAHGGWVTDQADLLSNEAEAQLNALLTQLEAQNGAEVAVVTVPDTAPSPSPKAFTTELFNTWGIGKAGQDNGVLVMVSKGDRRVEIETGYGMEAILPDARVGKIIREQMIPSFKQEDYQKAIVDGTLAVAVSIQPGLALPEIMPVELTQQAKTLVQTWEQDAIREQEQAARNEAERIAQKKADAERTAGILARYPVYPSLTLVGFAFCGVGSGLLRKMLQSQFEQVALMPIEVASATTYPQEQQLNRGVSLGIARCRLDNVFGSTWPYGILTAAGFSAGSAGAAGWILCAFVKSSHLGTLLGIPIVIFSALLGQALMLRGGLMSLLSWQTGLCQRHSLPTWPSPDSISGFSPFKYILGGILLVGFCGTLPAIIYLTVTDTPDWDLSQFVALASLAISVLFTVALVRLERHFRLRHLAEQTVCQGCNRGITPGSMTSSQTVRRATLHPEALSEAEAIAIDIGNVKYFAHACDRCTPGYSAGKTYLERHLCGTDIECPSCHEDTLESETTKTTVGKYYEYSRFETCHHCGYEKTEEWKKRKPKPKPVYSSSSSYSSSSYSSSSSSSSSWSGSSSSSSSGGSDFGGGESGGGGAGGSW